MFDGSASVSLRTGYRLQWEPRQSAWVLLYPEGMVVLNESAQAVLELCQDPIAIPNLVAHLEHQFPGEPIRDDILEFLRDAYERQWLTVS